MNMLFNKQVVVLCVLSISLTLVTADNIGDVCQLESGNTKAQCVLLKDCPEAIKNIKQGQLPQTCSFKGKEPVVCCEKTQKPVSGEISRQKCAEYGESVYTLQQSPSLLSDDSRLVKVDTCVSAAISVINYSVAFPGEFPHMALIGFGEENKKDWQCSGTLISDEFILTAAHCLFSRDLGPARWVRLGDLDISTDTDDAHPEDFSVLEAIKHPDFRPPIVYNDIALIKLNKRVKFNRFIRPACLHTSPDADAPRYIVTGWGNREFGADRYNVLQRFTLDKVSQEQCNETFAGSFSQRILKYGIVTETQICAGTKEKDQCQGDSGGPLQIYNKDVYCMFNVVGVTSFGRPCGLSSFSGVYTKVSAYIEWIEKIVWPQK